MEPWCSTHLSIFQQNWLLSWIWQTTIFDFINMGIYSSRFHFGNLIKKAAEIFYYKLCKSSCFLTSFDRHFGPQTKLKLVFLLSSTHLGFGPVVAFALLNWKANRTSIRVTQSLKYGKAIEQKDSILLWLSMEAAIFVSVWYQSPYCSYRSARVQN